MAKARQIIKDFSGGINNYDDARDIKENQFVDIQNWLVNRQGQMRTLADTPTANSVDSNLPTAKSASKIIPNHGLFAHGTDHRYGDMNASAADSGEYWIFKSDPPNMTIDAFPVNRGTWYDNRINLYDGSGPKSDLVPAYYVDEGVTRVCDANFGDNSVNQYHGYVENRLFQTDDAGTSLHPISRWSTGDQKLKSFEELGTVCRFWNYGYYGGLPTDSIVGVQNRILLVYWSQKGGKFNGQYEFGLSPVYSGKQEGPITIVTTSIGKSMRPLYDVTLMLQMFLSTASVQSFTAETPHVLTDDRIIGINCYFRHYAQEVWYHLKYFDMQSGDKYHWQVYSSAERLYGKWIGSLSLGTLTPSTSYKTSTLPVTVDVNSGVGYGESSNPEREMTLRLDGAYYTPIYKDFKMDGNSPYTVNIGLKNPSNGTSNYKVTLLDEAFGEVDSIDDDFTISDSGAAEPAESQGDATEYESYG